MAGSPRVEHRGHNIFAQSLPAVLSLANGRVACSVAWPTDDAGPPRAPRRRRRSFRLVVVGYAFYSLIAVKEPRHSPVS